MSRTAQEDRDLYILVGRYETFSQQVLQELKEINQCLEAGNKRFQEFEQRYATHGAHLDDHEKRLKNIEKTGIPKRTKQQLDGTTILTLINTIITFIQKLWPF